ncbi:uncharacterized protein LOC119091490 [Pollicipes pollicipes]|uniref:uncharacterized protein LOC119091490 n=1 Tax=Pollicipes pollicipes TaxID=41117 RepID=UPI0018858A61|nr:uncharacterized protein LOC119091490 [Pollicipes pollicipes]
MADLVRSVQSVGFGAVYYGGGEAKPGAMAPDGGARSYTLGAYTEMAARLYLGAPVSVRRLLERPPAGAHRDLLIAELEAARRLHHPALLLLMAVCPSDNLDGVALVFERVPLGSLHHCRYRRGLRLGARAAAELLLQVCDALQFLHAARWLHCAVTSHAVQLLSPTRAKLACLEHRRLLACRAEGALYNWLAPEVLRDGVPGEPADVYSFCALTWELMHGEPPWAELTSDEISAQAASPPGGWREETAIKPASHRLTRHGSSCSLNRRPAAGASPWPPAERDGEPSLAGSPASSRQHSLRLDGQDNPLSAAQKYGKARFNPPTSTTHSLTPLRVDQAVRSLPRLGPLVSDTRGVSRVRPSHLPLRAASAPRRLRETGLQAPAAGAEMASQTSGEDRSNGPWNSSGSRATLYSSDSGPVPNGIRPGPVPNDSDSGPVPNSTSSGRVPNSSSSGPVPSSSNSGVIPNSSSSGLFQNTSSTGKTQTALSDDQMSSYSKRNFAARREFFSGRWPRGTAHSQSDSALRLPQGVRLNPALLLRRDLPPPPPPPPLLTSSPTRPAPVVGGPEPPAISSLSSGAGSSTANGHRLNVTFHAQYYDDDLASPDVQQPHLQLLPDAEPPPTPPPLRPPAYACLDDDGRASPLSMELPSSADESTPLTPLHVSESGDSEDGEAPPAGSPCITSSEATRSDGSRVRLFEVACERGYQTCVSTRAGHDGQCTVTCTNTALADGAVETYRQTVVADQVQTQIVVADR